MKALVIGSGGREHAIVWALKRSPSVRQVYSLSANAGIQSLAYSVAADPNDFDALADFVANERIDLTIVGPEQPLVDGLTDRFIARGLAICGPSQAAARLEGSKAFAKDFMKRHSIPTARFRRVDHPAEAFAVLSEGIFSYPMVIKADGLAAGKGVIIAENIGQARSAIDSLMVARKLGAAGDRLIIEEYLEGRELSYLVFSDGKNYASMPVAQDYKRAFEGDRGPNTGGMGAFSAPEMLDEGTESCIKREIIEPTLEGAQRDGFPFRGVLYCGLMLTADGPRVLEYNVRLGDPEAQAILRRLESDFGNLCIAIVRGELNRIRPQWSTDATICIVLASAGYPGAYKTGQMIYGLEAADQKEDVIVFHAGTRRDIERRVMTAGGRILGVTARAAVLDEATKRAYAAIERIHFEGVWCRRDIGLRSR